MTLESQQKLVETGFEILLDSDSSFDDIEKYTSLLIEKETKIYLYDICYGMIPLPDPRGSAGTIS
jgi:hypothetical protein